MYNTEVSKGGDSLNFHGLNLDDNQPVYVQIAQYVKRQILLNQTFSGDSLPSRRDIAAQLRVNPNTVQKAFKLMEDDGYVHTSGKLGSRVYFDEEIRAQIEKEFTVEMVRQFIDQAKEINMSFKQVIDRISELWEG